MPTEATRPTDIAPLLDRFGRPLRDLRISVTDRCNFRCRYCMPREIFGPDFQFLPRTEILTFEEITRVVQVMHRFGLRKVRLTGGEPLLRADLPLLVAMVRQAMPDMEIALTTNASFLTERAAALAEAGLNRITVSLDSLDETVFHSMTDSSCTVQTVLDGIAAAQAAGLDPVKVNAVIRRGVNEHTLIDLARHFRGSGVIVRFIEFMDVGTTNGWKLDEVIPGREIVERIQAVFPLEPAETAYRGEVAKRWRYTDGAGEIGIITSITQPFCGDCTRARLSAEGKLYTCLFAAQGTDLRAALRSGADDDSIAAIVQQVWGVREDRYSEIRSEATPGLPKIEMSYIGG